MRGRAVAFGWGGDGAHERASRQSAAMKPGKSALWLKGPSNNDGHEKPWNSSERSCGRGRPRRRPAAATTG
eukprot:4677767-Alexandrium_andersonii.AAC.1